MRKQFELKEKWLPGRWVYYPMEKEQRVAWRQLTGKKHVTDDDLTYLRRLGMTFQIESTESPKYGNDYLKADNEK